jgi:hypothetical protein
MHIRVERMVLLGSFLGFEKRGELRIEIKVEYATQKLWKK